jgi:hypothetical protein
MEQSVTRRTLLAGAGATAAAATIGTLAPTAGAQASGAGASPFLPGGAPLAGAGAAVAPAALTAGLTYLTIDGVDFFPENPMATPRSVGTVPGASTTAGNVLLAPLLLAVDAVLKEVQVFYVAAAAPAPQFAIFKKDVTGAYNQLAPFSTLPLGTGVQTTTLTFNEPINGTATYLADFVANGANQVICALLVGYEPPPSRPAFVAVAPIARVLDTRTTGGKLEPNEERIVDLGVGGSVRAAVINLTVTETEVAGFVAVFPADVAYPGNSSINWSASNQNIANGVITAVDATGKIKIRGGVNPTHVVIDVQGALE